jgi:hypothetical protein
MRFCRKSKRFPKDYRKSIFSLFLVQIPKKMLLKMIFFSWFHFRKKKKLHQFSFFSLPCHCHPSSASIHKFQHEWNRIENYQLHSIRFWVPFFVVKNLLYSQCEVSEKSIKLLLSQIWISQWNRMMTPCSLRHFFHFIPHSISQVAIQ